MDDLGWFHFEQLVQSLLKAALGLSVQSWGGQGDLGRDAYTDGPLRFPDPSVLAPGPFVFQAKFLQGANAAGAVWQSSLLKSISQERTRIKRRRDSGAWRDPAHYILITNCPLNATARHAVETKLEPTLPCSQITALGGADICDLLDKHPELRRSFPEILSLRDYDLLLSEVVNSSVLERSHAAAEEARDLVPVFVPTTAYRKAWKSLLVNSFVVLDGPPEMGKTAIARTIAFAHLLDGWQVIECRYPNDLFSVLDGQHPQIFVADDAFGRTEYDPELGRKWELDLPNIFRRLDPHHRLIWTTRKHILMRALREMDLTGKATHFPSPGEVIVTADDLSTEEKARILYRHARAANLSSRERHMVRDNAVAIVKDAHFTPERIRRLVCELLPEVVKISPESFTPEEIEPQIRTAISHPTDRMRKSFRVLPSNHMWVLIALLECNGPVQPDVLSCRFSCLQPRTVRRTFVESLDDLMGTFVKVVRGVDRFRRSGQIDWIHPSYRDLVIDELSVDVERQLVFLRRMSVNGIKLALSVAGGSVGQRQLPLMGTAESWTILERRCREIASSEGDDVVTSLYSILASLLSDKDAPSSSKKAVSEVVRSLCSVTLTRWEERSEPLGNDALRSFHRACSELPLTAGFPGIEATWEARCSAVEGEIADGYSLDPYPAGDWSDFVDLVEAYYPGFAGSPRFRDRRAKIEEELFSLARGIARFGADLGDWDSNSSEANRLEKFGDVLRDLDSEGQQEETVAKVYGIAEDYRQHSSSGEPPDYDPEEWARPAREFDVSALFQDL